MSDNNTATDYSGIQAELESRLEELLGRARDADEELSEPPLADWDDNAIESEHDEVLERLGRAALDEVRQIRHALWRIGSGKYGCCENCECAIPIERLEALPFATSCVKCA